MIGGGLGDRAKGRTSGRNDERRAGRVDCEEMLRQAQHDIQNVLLLYVVILNEVKNLSGSTTFDPPTNWEILRLRSG